MKTSNDKGQEFREDSAFISSSLVSRNITILGRRTSIRLEPAMWSALYDISQREGCKIHDICGLIYARKQPNTSLTAAIRVFLMLYYKSASTEDGHKRAEHGDFITMCKRAKFKPSLKADNHLRRVVPLVYNNSNVLVCSG